MLAFIYLRLILLLVELAGSIVRGLKAARVLLPLPPGSQCSANSVLCRWRVRAVGDRLREMQCSPTR